MKGDRPVVLAGSKHGLGSGSIRGECQRHFRERSLVFLAKGHGRSCFQRRKAGEMKRKCRPKGLAQNPGNARQVIVISRFCARRAPRNSWGLRLRAAGMRILRKCCAICAESLPASGCSGLQQKFTIRRIFSHPPQRAPANHSTSTKRMPGQGLSISG